MDVAIRVLEKREPDLASGSPETTPYLAAIPQRISPIPRANHGYFNSATRLVVVPLFMAFGWLSSRDIPRVSSRSTSGGKFPAAPVSQICGMSRNLVASNRSRLRPSGGRSHSLLAVRGWTQRLAARELSEMRLSEAHGGYCCRR
jgi:hypothetical protein